MQSPINLFFYIVNILASLVFIYLIPASDMRSFALLFPVTSFFMSFITMTLLTNFISENIKRLVIIVFIFLLVFLPSIDNTNYQFIFLATGFVIAEYLTSTYLTSKAIIIFRITHAFFIILGFATLSFEKLLFIRNIYYILAVIFILFWINQKKVLKLANSSLYIVGTNIIYYFGLALIPLISINFENHLKSEYIFFQISSQVLLRSFDLNIRGEYIINKALSYIFTFVLIFMYLFYEVLIYGTPNIIYFGFLSLSVSALIILARVSLSK